MAANRAGLQLCVAQHAAAQLQRMPAAALGHSTWQQHGPCLQTCAAHAWTALPARCTCLPAAPAPAAAHLMRSSFCNNSSTTVSRSTALYSARYKMLSARMAGLSCTTSCTRWSPGGVKEGVWGNQPCCASCCACWASCWASATPGQQGLPAGSNVDTTSAGMHVERCSGAALKAAPGRPHLCRGWPAGPKWWPLGSRRQRVCAKSTPAAAS